MSWYTTVLKKYATFSGRARRKEYWMFALFNVLFGVALSVLATTTQVEALLYVYYAYVLATLIPGLAVAVRRLHDTGKSGVWLLIGLIPLIGGIWLLVLMVSAGTQGSNEYGSDPKTA